MNNNHLKHFEESGKTLVYFAAERTFLMWVRTGGTLMILGFAADRFVLFVNTVGFEQGLTKALIAEPFWMGVVILALGCLVNIVASVRFLYFHVRYQQGELKVGAGIPLVVGLSFVLALAGIVLTWMIMHIH